MNKQVGAVISWLILLAALIAAWGLIGLAWRWASGIWFGAA